MLGERSQVRVAVVIRGHKLDDKLRHLFRHMSSPDAEYDLFLLLDQSNGPLMPDFGPMVPFSRPGCAAMGLEYSTPYLFWLGGDFALYAAMRALPAYSHFIMIEYDLHFVRSGPAMMNAIVARLRDPARPELDAIGLQYSIVGADWPYHAAATRMFGEVRFFYFPFVVLSRRALAYLLAQRRLERLGTDAAAEPVICEAFVPGALAPAGFHCVDLHEVLPGSYASTGPEPTMRIMPYGLPLGAPVAVGPTIEMVHPVYSVEDHLRRGVQFATTPEEIAAFRRRLADPAYGFIDPALRDACEAQLAAKLPAMPA